MEPNFVKIPGYVWCDIHCGIHEDSNNPLYERGTCTKADHRSVYFDGVLADEVTR
jgi:hypothetical protein